MYASFGLIAGIGAFFPDKTDGKFYNLSAHLAHYPFISFLISCIAIILNERENFYTIQSEGAIYLSTLTFLYYVSPWQTYHKVIAVLGVAPSLFTIYCAFFDYELKERARFWLAIWTLILTIIYSLTQLFYGATDLASISVQETSVLKYLTYWAGFTLTAASGIYFVGAVIPLLQLSKGKNESSYAYEIRLAQQEKFLESRVLSSDTSIRAILFITIVHGVPLLMNWYYKFLPHSIATSYAMIISPSVTYGLSKWFLID
jgi:hypothetical protein